MVTKTIPDNYAYETDRVPTSFVSENIAQSIFTKDLTILPGFPLTIGDTVFVCLEELPGFFLDHITPQEAHTRGLERIRERQSEVIHRAKELRAVLGDPLAELARILQNLPVENDVWDRIIQEPYG